MKARSATPSRTRGGTTVTGNVWARMLRISLLCGAIIAVCCVALAAVVDGAAGAGSAGLGTVIVAAVFGISLGGLWWSSKYPAPVAALVMLVMYAALVAAGTMILFGAPKPEWVLPPWMGTAVIGQVVAWLGGSAVALRRSRLPVFDVDTRTQPREETV
ncbi:hypothetical protein GWK18_02890 [Kocuria sp. JC486]|uniref:hypothetical protein n=1 Tax=Kocuria sp. JC486 TaxID=1970736 RepID=UPI00141EA582|nr:hypothetical protein [Kocuria sp. JC486]NHU84552.1 hypothetical protein [Kocuria sp. JC486]